MNRGKHKCETLKKIRQMIANKNGIDYHTTECTFQGNCSGTCPKCEAELKYLESQLMRKESAGKKVAVAGLALGISLVASCGPSHHITKPLGGDVANVEKVSFTNEVNPPDTAEVEEATDDLMGIIIEDRAEFPGGEVAWRKYISANVQYPPLALENEIQGTVWVKFEIDEEGNLINPSILRSIDPLLDAEAIRVISASPKWQPAKRGGQYVKESCTTPVKFKLPE